ncbi:MAG: integrase core domain-containing protein [Candidatus Pacebacteria bacterium]|nr:integrase core domain-containing protein [Candidatus Paceibacterota bacterium]
MPYTTNKNMPRIRREAAKLMHRGWSARKVGRYLGFHHTAIMRWYRITRKRGDHLIPTRSSRPRSHPKRISFEIEKKILEIRRKHGRYGKAIHKELENLGIKVSLATVNRTLDRYGYLKKKSPWKRFHPHVERPNVAKRGDLIQIDTIHRTIDEKKRIYIFALIDLYSRDAYAKAYAKMNAATALEFVKEAEAVLGFPFNMIQSDRGPEFGKWFVSQIKRSHRYSRIGKPNDNAHIERFNRTLQEECLDKVPNNISEINCALKQYLKYYKYERLHAGINFLTPAQVV